MLPPRAWNVGHSVASGFSELEPRKDKPVGPTAPEDTGVQQGQGSDPKTLLEERRLPAHTAAQEGPGPLAEAGAQAGACAHTRPLTHTR